MAATAAALSCMGYGYDVQVRVNGIDLGVKGGKSESKRLFSPADEMVPQIPAEMRKQLVVLKDGANRIEIRFTKKGDKNDSLEVTIHTDGPEPVFSLTSKTKAAGSIDRTIDLGAGTIVLTDADLK